MEREKVRPLQNMPPKNKLAYSKLLTLMVNAEEPINQLKMAELYRLLANIQISTSKRQEILDFLLNSNREVEILCKEMMEDVNQQEVNILRFSIIKDLMIIMGADYVETANEKNLLSQIEGFLNITKEQKGFLVKEYQQDQVFHQGDLKGLTSDKIMKETMTKAVALGIPLSLVGFGGLYKGFGPLGVLSGLESIGIKKHTKRYSSAVGLGVSILSAFSAYHLIKWRLGHTKRKDNELKNLINEEMELIHARAIQYLEKDIEVYKTIRAESMTGINLTIINEKRDLLIRTLATLRNTKPKVI